MPYVEGRIIHDADSHLMELPDCLDDYFDPKLKHRYHALPIYHHKLGKPGWAEAARRQHEDPEFRAGAEENILLRKNQQALGAFRRDDRPKAIDYLGFASQLVFTTFCLGNFQLEYGDDVELCYAAATAHNRMMTDFCSVDRRLGDQGGDRARRQSDPRPLALPERAFAQSHCVRSGVGAG